MGGGDFFASLPTINGGRGFLCFFAHHKWQEENRRSFTFQLISKDRKQKKARPTFMVGRVFTARNLQD